MGQEGTWIDWKNEPALKKHFHPKGIYAKVYPGDFNHFCDSVVEIALSRSGGITEERLQDQYELTGTFYKGTKMIPLVDVLALIGEQESRPDSSRRVTEVQIEGAMLEAFSFMPIKIKEGKTLDAKRVFQAMCKAEEKIVALLSGEPTNEGE